MTVEEILQQGDRKLQQIDREEKELKERVKVLEQQRSQAYQTKNQELLNSSDKNIFDLCRKQGMKSIAIRFAVKSPAINDDFGMCYALTDNEFFINKLLEITTFRKMTQFLDKNEDKYVEIIGRPKEVDLEIDVSGDMALAFAENSNLTAEDRSKILWG